MTEELKKPLDENEVADLVDKLYYIGYRVAKGGQESMDLEAIARFVLMNVYTRQPTGLVPECIGICEECDKHFSAEEMEHFKDDVWGHKCKSKNTKEQTYCESYINKYGQPSVVLPKMEELDVHIPYEQLSEYWKKYDRETVRIILDAIKELNPTIEFKESV